MDMVITVSFKLNGSQAVFREAGHIMGSALLFSIFEDNGRKLSLCYTGDLGRPNMPIINDPDICQMRMS